MSPTGLGQQTGSDSPLADAAEALRILAIIEGADTDVIEYHCGAKAAKFVWDMRQSLINDENKFTVTGKMLFFLRDVRDQLVEKGIV